jgi:CO/xanthine dehydrogenase Mo-binding subunit
MHDPRKDLTWREIEPERYEVFDGPAHDVEITRRELWKVLGAGVLLVFTDRLKGAPSGELLSTRLHLGEDGIVTLMTGKVEIGQGARTELTQVVAEELRIDSAKVHVVMGDTDLVPDDGGTWASLTTPQTVPVVRRAAAAARELLPQLDAGEQLSGVVPKDVALTDPEDWRICGTSLPKVGARAIVTGEYRYSCDLDNPEMMTGRVKRAPFHRAVLASFDASEATKLPGVQVVHDGNFLGVVAPDRSTAEAALNRLEAKWKVEPLLTADKLGEHFKSTAQEPVFRKGAAYPALLEAGSIAEGMEEADEKLESVYSLRYIAHVPMEPRSALAEWKDDSLTVRTGTQVPFGARRELAEAFHISEDKVRVISSDSGGGFGGKHKGECPLEAARLAKAAGKPVMLEWTREEEFTCAYARPAGLLEVRSGFLLDGRITAWDFHNYNSGAAGIRPPYDLPNVYCGFHRADSPVRQGSYRSLAAVANTFAREMHVEEIADRLGMDPVELRIRNLKEQRTREVLKIGADRFGWRTQKAGDGRGFGVACTLEKNGHLALFVEIETDGRNVRVRRMVMAADFGAVVNPDNLRNQITGAMIQGLGGALFEELEFDLERITNPSLLTYRVPRFSDVPEIDIALTDRRDVASAGAGEAPIAVVAPAIGAALHNATGEWHRSLPMTRTGD